MFPPRAEIRKPRQIKVRNAALLAGEDIPGSSEDHSALGIGFMAYLWTS